MSRPLTLAVALSLLLSSALATQAQDTGLPEPFSPWLENKPYPEEYKRAYLPEEGEETGRILPNPRDSADKQTLQEYEPDLRPNDKRQSDSSQAELAPSPLENLYSHRAGQPLRQFGYDLFNTGSESLKTEESNAPPRGPVMVV